MRDYPWPTSIVPSMKLKKPHSWHYLWIHIWFTFCSNNGMMFISQSTTNFVSELSLMALNIFAKSSVSSSRTVTFTSSSRTDDSCRSSCRLSSPIITLQINRCSLTVKNVHLTNVMRKMHFIIAWKTWEDFRVHALNLCLFNARSC